jgi:DNA-binding response OmpR family regulator
MAKVLVVDDNIYILELLNYLLTRHGFTVQNLLNGKGTIEQLQTFKADLILLDISLSGCDGREICKQLKSHGSQFKDIPVILFSSMSDLEEKYLECKADDFIQKPFNTVDLVAKIRKYTIAAEEYTI